MVNRTIPAKEKDWLYAVVWYARGGNDILILKSKNVTDAGNNTSKYTVQKANRFVMGIVYFFLRIYYFLCGVHIKAVNKIGAPEKPSIILCNHGSFIDFIFAATLLRKYTPNVIVARLYFYDKCLKNHQQIFH